MLKSIFKTQFIVTSVGCERLHSLTASIKCQVRGEIDTLHDEQKFILCPEHSMEVYV